MKSIVLILPVLSAFVTIHFTSYDSSLIVLLFMLRVCACFMLLLFSHVISQLVVPVWRFHLAVASPPQYLHKH